VGLLDLFKLERLTIEAYETSDRNTPPVKKFEAMYNPASLNQSYGIKWGKNIGVNASGAPADYQFSKPAQLEFDLILDGTGVEQMGVVNFFSSKSVKERVSDFLEATYDYQGKIHEPYYLKVKWGLPDEFKCRLSSVDITYTSFNRDGTPLRAELRVSLISDEDVKKLVKKENKQSSDLTHSRMLRAGDTLPLLTREIYGSSTYYLDVARFNNMDDFRGVNPGQQVLFPPLEILIGGR
jgi:hypothetical protein